MNEELKSNIIDKLNQKIITLTDEEWELVASDTDIFNYFLKRIKEKALIDDNYFRDAVFGKLIENNMLHIWLEYMKNNNIEELVEIYANIDNNIEQLADEYGETTVKALKDFYIINKEEILHTLDNSIIINEITSKEFIDYIINNNLTFYIPSIIVDNPSPEIEDFIINNVNSINSYIQTISDRIIEAFIANNKLRYLKNLWNKSPIIEEALFKAYIQGQLTRNDLNYEFINKYKTNKDFFKAAIVDTGNVFNYYDEEIKELLKDKEIEDFIVRNIEEKRKINLYSTYFYSFKILLAAMKYSESFTLYTLKNMDESTLKELYNKSPEEFKEALIVLTKRDNNDWIISYFLDFQDTNFKKKLLNIIIESKVKIYKEDFSKIVDNFINENNLIEKELIIKIINSQKIELEKNYESILKLLRKSDDDIKEAIKNFILMHKNVPIRITTLFDKDVRIQCTYNMEALSKNPELFLDGTLLYEKKEMKEFVREAMNNNVPIDIHLLVQTCGLSEVFNYNNITYNHHLAHETIYKLCKEFSSSPVTIRILQEYINIIDISVIMNSKLIDLLNDNSISEEIKKIIIDSIKNHIMSIDNATIMRELSKLIQIDEIMPNILKTIQEWHLSNNYEKVYWSSILNILVKCKNTENEEQAKNIIFNIINEKEDYITFDRIPEEAFSLNYPELDDILLPKLIRKIDNFRFLNPSLIEIIKNNNNIVEVIIDKLPECLDTLRDYATIDKFLNISQIIVDKVIKLIQDKEVCSTYIDLFLHPKIAKVILLNTPSKIVEYMNILDVGYIEKYMDFNTFNIMEKYIEDYYKLGEGNLRLIIDTFGLKILNKNTFNKLLPLLKEDKSIVEKFINIYKIRNLDVKTIKAINDPLQQELYMTRNEYERNIFNYTLLKISNGELNVEEEIERFCKKNEQGDYLYLPATLQIDKKELEKQLITPENEKRLSKEELDKIRNIINTAVDVVELYKTNKEEALRKIFSGILINELIYTDLLHQITDHFIDMKREEVKRKEDIFVDTDVSKKINTHKLPEVAFSYYCINRRDDMIKIIEEEIKKPNSALQEDKKNTYIRLIDFFAKRINNIPKEDMKEIKNLKKTLLTNYFANINPNLIPADVLPYYDDEVEYIRRKIEYRDLDNIDIISVIRTIKNEDRYECLINLIEKYKIFEWGNIFKRTISSMGICEDDPDMFIFVNCFEAIYKEEKKKQLQKRKEKIAEEIKKLESQKNGINNDEIDSKIKELKDLMQSSEITVEMKALPIIRQAVKYTSNPSIFKLLFGLEDYELIRDNPPKNSATIPNLTVNQTAMKRFERNRLLLFEALKVEKITVPSFIKNYNSDKPLQAIIGCKADPRNLTLGERTGACMRAYGVGNNLFEFVVADPKGFNIVFVDPETNEFVSRISGFRNGNTVFLNQLRYSCIPEKYSDEDVIKALKSIANDLIEFTKNSPNPIENVVASPTYALENRPTTILNVSQEQFRYFDGWLDVSNNAIVLASTGKKVELDPEGKIEPIYPCCRLKPREYRTNQITDVEKVLIQRINVIKDIKAAKDDPEYYRCLEIDEKIMENIFLYAIIGQDFYVAIDINNNLIHNSFGTTEEALKEYEESINRAQELLNSLSINGGIHNG